MHTHKGIFVLLVLSLNLALDITQAPSLFRKQRELVPTLNNPPFGIVPRTRVG